MTVSGGAGPNNSSETAGAVDEIVDIIASQYRDPDVARSAINDFRDWLNGQGMSEGLTSTLAMHRKAARLTEVLS